MISWYLARQILAYKSLDSDGMFGQAFTAISPYHLAWCLDNRIELVTTRIMPATTACAIYAQTQCCTAYRYNQRQSLAHMTHICTHFATLHATSRATSEKNKHTSHETRSYQQTHLAQKTLVRCRTRKCHTWHQSLRWVQRSNWAWCNADTRFLMDFHWCFGVCEMR